MSSISYFDTPPDEEEAPAFIGNLPFDGADDTETGEKPLWVSETPWPTGDIPAAIWTNPYLSLFIQPWAVVAELDAFAVPWSMIIDDDIVLLYVPENSVIGEIVLQDAGLSRFDGWPFGTVGKAAVDYQQPHHSNHERPVLFRIFHVLFGSGEVT